MREVLVHVDHVFAGGDEPWIALDAYTSGIARFGLGLPALCVELYPVEHAGLEGRSLGKDDVLGPQNSVTRGY